MTPTPRVYSVSLETFLSGMETRPGSRGPDNAGPALKPSLVEWKPSHSGQAKTPPIALETFLSGMETQYIEPEDWPTETP